jgi:hypothetical protein
MLISPAAARKEQTVEEALFCPILARVLSCTAVEGLHWQQPILLLLLYLLLYMHQCHFSMCTWQALLCLQHGFRGATCTLSMQFKTIITLMAF